jgi:hypothetical protein
VGFAGEWAGLNCIDSLTEDRVPTYPWVNETQLCLDGQTKAGAKEIAHYTEYLPVHLSPLPCWADLEANKRWPTGQGGGCDGATERHRWTWWSVGIEHEAGA